MIEDAAFSPVEPQIAPLLNMFFQQYWWLIAGLFFLIVMAGLAGVLGGSQKKTKRKSRQRDGNRRDYPRRRRDSPFEEAVAWIGGGLFIIWAFSDLLRRFFPGGLLFFQQYGVEVAGLIVLIAGGALYMGIEKKRRRRLEEEIRFRALRLVDLHSINPAEFEKYVAKLLDHRGYTTKVVGQAGDMGVDVIARKGPEKYAVQVKRYSNPVSRTAVSDAVAGGAYHGCNSAMVVTNNYFTAGARALAQSTNCQLIDRDVLAKWIAELG